MISLVKNYSLGVVCFLTTILYLIHVFIPSNLINTIFSSLAAILLFFSLFIARLSSKVTAIILLSIGTIIFIVQQVETNQILLGFGQNINLITIFLVVPLLGVIISIGGYLTALKQKVQEIEKNRKAHPYALSYVLTASMGVILNLGAMPIVYRIAEESFSSFEKKKMGVVLLRAFTFCMFWSPFFVNVGLVLVLFDVSWSQIGWIGLLMALLYLMISLIFFKKISFSAEESIRFIKDVDPIDSHEVTKKLISLLIWSLALLTTSFLLDYLLNVNMLTIVSILALIFPLIWALSIGILVEFVQTVVQHILNSFHRLKNEIVLFISAGYFGLSLTKTEVGQVVSTFIFDMSYGSVYLMSVLIIIFCVTLAIVGIHPVIVIIGVGSSLSPDLFNVSPAYMAIVLLISWSLATQVSPFSGSVLMTASIIKESPWNVAKQNFLFVLLLIFIMPFVLYLLKSIHLV